MSKYFIIVPSKDTDKPLASRQHVTCVRSNYPYDDHITQDIAIMASSKNQISVVEVEKDSLVSMTSGYKCISVTNPQIVGVHKLLSYDTIKTFGLEKVINTIILCACIHNDTDFLQEIKDNMPEVDWNISAGRYATRGGHVGVLEWYKKNGFTNLFTSTNVYSVVTTADINYMESMNWYITNGYKQIEMAIQPPQSYHNNIAIFITIYALRCAKFGLLESFYNNDFGIDFKNAFDKHAREYIPETPIAYGDNIMNLIDWLKKNNKIDLIDSVFFRNAIKSNNIVAATWCWQNGIRLKNAVHIAVDYNNPKSIAMLEWIKQHGCNMQLTTSTYTVSDNNDTTVADTTVADTTVADNTVADNTVADTTVADTTVADNTVAETAVVADTWWQWAFGK
jgi:hypothetical protein